MMTQSNPSPDKSRAPGAKLADAAGGTAIDCAAVCCCCPLAVAKLFVLAALLPAGLLCRSLRRWRRRKRDRRRLAAAAMKTERFSDDDLSVYRASLLCRVAASDESPEMVEMEREMWARFYGAGFWRSPSQRESILVGKVN